MQIYRLTSKLSELEEFLEKSSLIGPRDYFTHLFKRTGKGVVNCRILWAIGGPGGFSLEDYDGEIRELIQGIPHIIASWTVRFDPEGKRDQLVEAIVTADIGRGFSSYAISDELHAISLFRYASAVRLNLPKIELYVYPEFEECAQSAFESFFGQPEAPE